MVKVMMLLSIVATTLCACFEPSNFDAAWVRPGQATDLELILVPSHSQIVTHVSHPDDGLRVDVYDERGIGALDISVARPFPGPLVVRLHLQALEEFILQAGDQRIVTHGSRGRDVVSSMPGRSDTGPLAPKPRSALIPLVAAYHGDGSPAQSVPLEAGYFDIQLSAALTTAADSSFSIAWVDYFR